MTGNAQHLPPTLLRDYSDLPPPLSSFAGYNPALENMLDFKNPSMFCNIFPLRLPEKSFLSLRPYCFSLKNVVSLHKISWSSGSWNDTFRREAEP